MKRKALHFSFFIFLTLCFLASKVKADDLYFYSGGWSKHFKRDPVTKRPYNSKHELLGIEYRNWGVSHFTNSFYNNSTTLTYSFKWPRDYYEYDLAVGLVHGYDSTNAPHTLCKGHTCLLWHPKITYTAYDIQPSLGFLGEAVVLTIRVKY